jgi:hypothetical protein
MFSSPPYYHKPEAERPASRFLKHINADAIALALTALIAILAATRGLNSASTKDIISEP